MKITYEVYTQSLIKSRFGKVGLSGYLIWLLMLRMKKQEVLPTPSQWVSKEYELTVGYDLGYDILMMSLRLVTDILSCNTASKVVLKVPLEVYIAKNSELKKKNTCFIAVLGHKKIDPKVQSFHISPAIPVTSRHGVVYLL